MATTKRITKEYADLKKNPPPGLSISIPDESNMHLWHVRLQGPEKTPFQGGTFLLHLTLPTDYPFKPPSISFQTKIYHPNVSNDDKGSMCLGILRPEEWKPATKLLDVLLFTQQVVREPNAEDAVEQGIANEYRERRSEWERIAREWCGRYAGGK